MSETLRGRSGRWMLALLLAAFAMFVIGEAGRAAALADPPAIRQVAFEQSYVAAGGTGPAVGVRAGLRAT